MYTCIAEENQTGRLPICNLASVQMPLRRWHASGEVKSNCAPIIRSPAAVFRSHLRRAISHTPVTHAPIAERASFRAGRRGLWQPVRSTDRCAPSRLFTPAPSPDKRSQAYLTPDCGTEVRWRAWGQGSLPCPSCCC